jgi:glycosyltransferase involved in cell wall biosynthesis
VAYSRSRWFDPRSIDEAISRKIITTPVKAIGNPIDAIFWRPNQGSGHRSSTVVSIGRLEWQKGHSAAMEIVFSSRSKSLHLSCMAPTSSLYGYQVERRAARSSEQNRLALKIGMTAEQRLESLQDALCLISWSETEYQSLAMLEALACGCPVIARPRGWLLHGPIPGVLVTNSKKQASRWLDDLAHNPSWAEQLGSEGHAYVKRYHALDVVSKQWTELFEQMLASR